MGNNKRNWWLWAALALVLIGQLNNFPGRIGFIKERLTFLRADGVEDQRLAYGAADYDLLQWVAQNTPPDSSLLLVTASPQTYGDLSYVLYHRAITHLAPRSVWWAAPVPATRYPAWWTTTDLNEPDVLQIAHQRQADIILADGFKTPPISKPHISFDGNTHLIFLSSRSWQNLATLNPRQHCHHSPSICYGKQVGWTSLGLVTIFAWGDLLLLWLGTNTSRHRRRLALAWLLGCGATSFFTFLLLWVGVSLTSTVMGLSVMGWAGWLLLLIRNRGWVKWEGRGSGKRNTTPHPNPLPQKREYSGSPLPWGEGLGVRELFLLILTFQIGIALFAALVSPVTDWDAWVNWASKANLIFIEQTITPNLYHNLARLPTNMDYPLLLPLTESWLYTWVGDSNDFSIGIISFLFYGALLLLFYDVSRRIAPTPAALGVTVLLATIPRLERAASSGLADIPLAAFVLLAFVLLYEQIQKPKNEISAKAILLLGITTGCLPWLKNEGWLWWGIITGCWLIYLGFLIYRQRLSRKRTIILLITYLLPALILALPWPYFLYLNGTHRFTFMPLTLTNFLDHLHRLPTIIIEMGKRLLNPYWNFIWHFIGLTILLKGWQLGRERFLGTQRHTEKPLRFTGILSKFSRSQIQTSEGLKVSSIRLNDPLGYPNSGEILSGDFRSLALPRIRELLKLFSVCLCATYRAGYLKALRGTGWLLFPTIAYLTLISLTYLFSRFDPYQAHLNNSIERLIQQALPLGLWWLAGQWTGIFWKQPSPEGNNEENP